MVVIANFLSLELLLVLSLDLDLKIMSTVKLEITVFNVIETIGLIQVTQEMNALVLMPNKQDFVTMVVFVFESKLVVVTTSL